jgi:hypothetical protein
MTKLTRTFAASAETGIFNDPNDSRAHAGRDGAIPGWTADSPRHADVGQDCGTRPAAPNPGRACTTRITEAACSGSQRRCCLTATGASVEGPAFSSPEWDLSC